jgi:hypothetical protein
LSFSYGFLFYERSLRPLCRADLRHIPKRGTFLFKNKQKLSLIPTGIAFIMTVYDAINVESVINNTSGIGDISLGIGFWIIIIGTILAVGSVVLEYIKNKKTVSFN